MNISIVKKKALIFLYSALISYFIIYKFAFETFYHIQLGGGDFGYLAILLTWPIYLFCSIPLAFSFKKISKNILLFSPFIIGLLILVVLTFTGRAIYEPLYSMKMNEIQEKVTIEPVKFEVDKSSTLTGAVKINSDVNFPIIFYIEKIYEPIPNDCQINTVWEYQITKGQQIVEFNCGAGYPKSINPKASILNFVIEEKENAGVKVKKTLPLNQFIEIAK